MYQKISLSLLLWLTVTACGGDPEIDAAALALCARPEHAFAIGTGTARFNSVQKGQEIWFEPGIQGGFHIWGAVRAGDVDPVDRPGGVRPHRQQAGENEI